MVKTLSQLITEADAANAARDWPAAEAGYAEALAIDPSLAAIWVQYGHALKEQSHLDRAEQAYYRALALDVAVADTHLQLGHLEKLRGRLGEAALHYRRALHLTPDSQQYRNELAQLPALVPGPVLPPDVMQTSDAWKAYFKLAEFRALNPAVATVVSTAAEAHAWFLRHGIDSLAPIAVDLIFDADFYRAKYADVRDHSPADAYRHWLFRGVQESRYVSESDVYQRALNGRPTFPANFDWASYVQNMAPRPNGSPAYTRLEAVEHLLALGFATGAPVPTSDGKPSLILEAIADYAWGRNDRGLATKAILQAIDAMPTNGQLRHKLGDYYIEQGHAALAASSFETALTLGYHSIWTYLHLIDNALRQADFASGYTLLAASRPSFSGEAIWRRKLQAVIDADFSHAGVTNRAILKSPTPDAADVQLTRVLDRIAAAYRDLDEMPVRLPAASDGHVVMFCLHLVPQCLHYRVQQRCEQFDALDIEYKLFAGDQPNQAREALVGARALLIYREPASPETIRLILHARAMGIPTIYEIDDLIFEAAHYPDPFSLYKEQISYDDYIGLLQGRTLYRYAMALSDLGVGSTEALCQHIAAVVRTGVCHLVPNGLDSRNTLFLQTPPPVETDKVMIFYGSGTKAHNRNFNECAGQALVDVLAARSNARLVIVGYLDLDPAFSSVEGQVIRLNFDSDLTSYWSLLSAVDINLALLVHGEMNDCKSEIKWLEAAAAAIPSIVSPSATYRAMLTDGADVLMAATPETMHSALLRLVDDPALRRDIGLRARRHAIDNYSLASTAARVAALLQDASDHGAEAHVAGDHGPDRPRILLVNVFFPPQTFGGATRVVRDNLDDFLDHHAGDFDVAVFTTDMGGPVNSARVGSYRGIPVFRVWPVLGENPEWDFDRADVAAAFTTVLETWKPDLVHFHCIQFLTGSLPQACQDSGIPYVVTLHDGWWLSQYQFFLDQDYVLRMPDARGLLDDSAKGGLLRVMRRTHFLTHQLNNAAAVIAVSEKFADIYRKAGIAAVRAIPNGISSSFASVSRSRAPRQGRVRIGHVSGWAFHKGIHLFQAALIRGNFGNMEAIVVDHTREPSHKVELIWGTTPVTIVGKVPQEDVLTLYDQIDVLVAPSIWPESYGLVSREALQCGLWVVASDLGAIGEDVIEGENGFLVDVSTAQGLTTALQAIDAYPDRYKTSPAHHAPLRLAKHQADDLTRLYSGILATGGEATTARPIKARDVRAKDFSIP